MWYAVVGLATAALGIEVGWQPRPEGGVEYLIQIEPHVLDSLRSAPLASDIRPEVKDIRAFRITVGTQRLPRVLPPAAPAGEPAAGPRLADKLPSAWPSEPLPLPRPLLPQEPVPATPGTFLQDPGGKPLPGQPTTFVQPSGMPPSGGESTTARSAPEEPRRPWALVTVLVLALSASVSWNGYLVWLLYEARRRFRTLLSGHQEPGSAEEEQPAKTLSDDVAPQRG